MKSLSSWDLPPGCGSTAEELPTHLEQIRCSKQNSILFCKPVRIRVMAVAQCAKASGIHGYVACSIPAVTPRHGTITTINALRGTKKKKICEESLAVPLVYGVYAIVLEAVWAFYGTV
jgi:hypothetical protein